MRLTLALICTTIALAVACGGGGSPAAPTTSTTTSTTSTSTLPIPTTTTGPGCTIVASTAGTPITAPSGPYYHNTAIALTSNGLAVTSATDALAHASVPDVTLLPDGSIGVYYVNGETDGIWLARVNGTSATPVSAIKIDGFIRPQGAVDPDAYLTASGKVRLTYLFGFSSGSNHRICMAESSDGVNFTTLGLSMTFSGQTETDPSVAQMPDGSWLMAVSRGTSTMLARSSDGLTFTEFSQVSYGGVPELATLSDGRVRLYVCSTNGLSAYASSDKGSSWTSEGSVSGASIPGRPGVCDPSALLSRNLFVFKTQ